MQQSEKPDNLEAVSSGVKNHTLSQKHISDAKDDKIGFTPQVNRLVDYIVHSPKELGTVIAVCGEWGSGKTSLINLAKRKLKQDKKPSAKKGAYRFLSTTFQWFQLLYFKLYRRSKEKQIEILSFNPWMFSGHQDLIQKYFEELSKIKGTTKKFKQLIKKYYIFSFDTLGWCVTLFKYFFSITVSNGVFHYIQSIPFIQEYIKKFIDYEYRFLIFNIIIIFIAFIIQFFKFHYKQLTAETLEKLKSEINKDLEKLENKIVVIIDDLDRLEPKELLEIFKMVKSVADFPNIIYILAFDKLLVSQMIGNLMGYDGERYLEKIVNYEIDVPWNLECFFTEEIKKVTGVNIIKHCLQINKYLQAYCTTPRNAKKIIANFNLHYKIYLKGEEGYINRLNLFAITTLQLLDYKLYQFIKDNKDKIIGKGNWEEDRKNYLNLFENELGKADRDNKTPNPKRQLICDLFPRVNQLFEADDLLSSKTTQYDNDSADINNCVSHPSHFDKYFDINIQEKEISQSELKEFFSHFGVGFNKENVVNKIKEINDKKHENRLMEQIHSFLLQLGHHYSNEQKKERDGLSGISSSGDKSQYIPLYTESIIKNIPLHFENVLKFFIYEGDNLIKDSIKNYICQGIVKSCFEFFVNNKPSYKNPINILKEAINQSESCFFVVDYIAYYLINENNPHSSLLTYLKEAGHTDEELIELRKAMINKIKNAADNGTLINIDPNIALLGEIMYRWSVLSTSVFGNINDIKKWVESVTRTDKELENFLIKALSDKSGIRLVYDNIIKEVAGYLDIHKDNASSNKIIERVNAIITQMSSEAPHKSFLEDFVKKCLE